MTKSTNIIFFLLFLGATLSCHEPSSNASTNSIAFSMDTVFVDAKTEFLYLFENLAGSSISRNKSLLYVFNRVEMVLEVIDLDSLKLRKKVQFEIEGPNGIGPYISAFSIYESDKIIFHTNNRYGLFDFTGNKIQTVEFDSWENGVSDVEYLSRLYSWDNENMHLGIISNSVSDIYYLGYVDLQNEKVERVPLPKFKDLKDYYLTRSRNGKISGGFGPRIQITQSPDKLILSSDYANKFYLYHPDTTNLIFKRVVSNIMPNQKELPEFNVAQTTEQNYSFHQAYFEDINFLPPFWDETREVFLRFSFKDIYGDLKNEYGKPIASSSQVFLTVFDKDLNILAETRVKEMNKRPEFHFAKDGKIWIFENMEDEMSFVRFSFDF